MKQQKEDLDVLFPANFNVIGGEQINLRPFVFGKWPIVIKKSVGIVNTIMKVLEEKGEESLDISLDATSGISANTELFSIITGIVEDGGDDLFDILAISARKDRQWVDELEGEDGIKLLLGTIQVNKDFFIKKVAPMLMSAKMQKKAELLGEK